jgi:hypothetical protein
MGNDLRAAGIDDADLAQVAGHAVETMLGTYTHALGRSHDRIRQVIAWNLVVASVSHRRTNPHY